MCRQRWVWWWARVWSAVRLVEYALYLLWLYLLWRLVKYALFCDLLCTAVVVAARQVVARGVADAVAYMDKRGEIGDSGGG